MDYSKRFDELSKAIEMGELTEAEKAELKLYYSMALLALRESGKAISIAADKLYNDLRN